ncbi:reverse transcriptase domain-containing protein [Tanacetum coccineum]
MPFGMCNATATFQWCMMAIFHELIKDSMKVFMDDLSVFGNSFDHCLLNLKKMLKRCEKTNLVQNWEKCYFMVREGIVLEHKVSGVGIEVDRAKIDSIVKLLQPTNAKAIRSFLGHAGFYRRFIKDFSQVVRPLTQLLVKDAPFIFFEEYLQAFENLKHELTQAPVMIKPDWTLPFKIMCDASDYAVVAVLGQRINNHFQPIHYAGKTMNVVFDIEIRDKKGAKNRAADHLSRLENPKLKKLTKAEIRDMFPEEKLMSISDQNNEPWYADYANYLASRVLHVRTSRQEKQKFFSELRHYFWDEPYLFKQCADQIIRRCVAEKEASQILRQCHSGPSGGHHGISTTAQKVYEAGFYWPNIFCDAIKLVIDFMGPFPSSNGNKYILVAIDYVSKWVEAQALPTSDARNMIRARENRFLQINELDELRLKAYESSVSYKERTNWWHDKRINPTTEYEKGDNVLLFNSRLRLFHGKLKSRSYRPFTVNSTMKNRAIALCDQEGNEFIVNRLRVKPYNNDSKNFDSDDDIILENQ